jgi:RNA polymerase sigma-19 factor, ECF subfamily
VKKTWIGDTGNERLKPPIKQKMNLDEAESTFAAESARSEGAAPRAGSAPAWESFYADLRRFVAHRIGGLRRIGGVQDTDDVVHDIYQEVLRSRCDEVTNPRAWIFRIAWRVLHEALNHEKRHRHYHRTADPEIIESLRDASARNADILGLKIEAREQILLALQGLPLAAQIAIVRSRVHGCSYEEIAVELGVTTNMVKKHISSAIAHFDAHLARMDGRSSGKEIEP